MNRNVNAQDQEIARQKMVAMLANSLSKLPKSVDNFLSMVTNYNIFADKTMFIRDIIKQQDNNMLILRPRRFGKSTLMSMLFYFFAKNIDRKTGMPVNNQNRLLFTGGSFLPQSQLEAVELKPMLIASYPHIIKKHQGVYPVIHLNWGHIEPKSSEIFVNMFSQQIQIICQNHIYLKEFLFQEKYQQQLQIFIRLQKKQASRSQILNSVYFFVRYLHLFHKKKVLLLVDEYDRPFNYMLFNGIDVEERKLLMGDVRTILNKVLKGNDDHLSRSILTGVFDIFSSQVGSGFNNLQIQDATSPTFWKYFGFSQKEVLKMIRQIFSLQPQTQEIQNHLDLQKMVKEREYWENQVMDQIRRWYNGYIVEQKKEKMFNPFSVIKYLYNFKVNGMFQVKSYWVNTGSDKFFQQIFSIMNQKSLEKLANLIRIPKEQMALKISTKIGLSELNLKVPLKEQHLSYLLLSAGYLTGVILHENILKAVIPNLETCNKFHEVFLDWIYESQLKSSNQNDNKILQKLSQLKLQDSQSLQKIAFQDIQDNKEKFGQCNEAKFCSRFFSILSKNKQHCISVEVVVPGGRIDHILYPMDKSTTTVIIHQYKYDQRGLLSEKLCLEGLWQVYEKNYLSHVLSSCSQDNIQSVLVRAIVIGKKDAMKGFSLVFSRDQCHSIIEAKEICAFFRSRLRDKVNKDETVFDKVKQKFEKLLKQESSGAILTAIRDTIQEEKRAGERQKVVIEHLSESIKKIKIKRQEQKLKESPPELKQDNFGKRLPKKKMEDSDYQDKMEKKPPGEVELFPSNFNYNLVGERLPGKIGRQWKLKTNNSPNDRPQLTLRFKARFPDGQSLFDCSEEEIMEVEGMNLDYAEWIYTSIQTMKGDTTFYRRGRSCEN